MSKITRAQPRQYDEFEHTLKRVRVGFYLLVFMGLLVLLPLYFLGWLAEKFLSRDAFEELAK